MSEGVRPEGQNLNESQLRTLLEVGRELVSELDLDSVLNRLLVVARDLTGARYAAIGVLDAGRTRLERFLTSGIDPATHAAIGDLPRGRGVLGMLIDDPWPLRVADVATHPESYGFPAGHPPMHTFLGVPVVIRGQVWGNLYLTETRNGEFSADDEEVVVALAAFAGVAIDNARQMQLAEQRREELESSTRRLEAAQAIAMAIGAESDLGRILELIVKRGRALLNARSLLILLRDGDELAVAATAGVGADTTGVRLPVAGSTSGAVLMSGRPVRTANAERDLKIPPQALGVPDAHTALVMPLVYRGRALGVLIALDRAGGEAGEAREAREEAFSADDEHVLRAFAASAATAVASVQEFASRSLRLSLESAEAERSRWARDLHDDTLQELAALRLLLSGARKPGADVRASIDTAIDRLGETISGLRALITDLRPAALDQLGLAPALEALVARVGQTSGLEVQLTVAGGEEGGRLSPPVEIVVYRLVQEALTNVVKHARASRASVSVVSDGACVGIDVRDEGVGFQQEGDTSGFGLVGMSERVALVGGRLQIESAPGRGTHVRAEIPLVASGRSA